MQTQELTASDYLFKLWPWIEANVKRIAYVVGAVALLVCLYFYYSSSQTEKEVTAGRALTQVLLSSSASQQADAYLKIAADYPATLAGQRALLAGGTTLFTSGKYPEAQAQFQKFLDAYPDSTFAAQARLGVAASLDAQGKTDLAISAYQKAGSPGASIGVTASAKFAIARIYEAQGKAADAMKLYEEVASSYPNTSLSSEAGLRAMELKMKTPPMATKSATAAAATPLTLTH